MRNVLITGGTGSFGQKFVEIVLDRFEVERLVVFSRDELKQSEMSEVFPDSRFPQLRYFIGDVRDESRLRRAFQGVDTVVHAAALKQVPACEYNPFEAVQTNVIGARNVIEAAIDSGVEKVVAISTDKAVNPVNLYGATKLCAEKMFVHANAYAGATGTRFAVCRYGNVAGSRGSVLPLFQRLEKTGRLTVTDERMTRFWITREQGVELVLHAIEIMRGGEIFVPKIPSVAILDIAKAVAPEAEIDVIGIRAGEKLHEVLVSEEEARHTIEQDDLYIVQPTHPWWGGEPLSGTPMEEGRPYASNTNDDWLPLDVLRELAS